MRMLVRFAAFALTVAAVHGVGASVPTMNDCLEASDFVANAARSRDNGLDREAFVERLREDFVAIRAFPPSLRWFVHDQDDETFLEDAAIAVFERPQLPERHRETFLRACLERLANGAAPVAPAATAETPDTI
jgi:hypothetical protein